MLIFRPTGRRNIDDYQEIIGSKKIESLKEMAQPLAGKKVVHVNATPRGGGVAEMLKSQIPLERSLGLKSSWYYIDAEKAGEEFFATTKKIHNGLQGLKISFSQKELDRYLEANQEIAKHLQKLKPDLVVIHDPQPMAAAQFYKESPLFLRIHPDLSSPNSATLKLFSKYFLLYPKVVFSLPQYVPSFLPRRRVIISCPAIDPLSEKNIIYPPQKFKKALAKIGINPSKPFMAQISRFEIWKDPLGVLQAYYLAKKKVPDLQVVLMGVMEAQDDPTAPRMYRKVKKYAGGDPDIILLSDLKGLALTNGELVNALQNCANPILQLSLREGFGLTVTEAMWKGRVVIGRRVGGIKVQIKDGVNGFLVETPQEAARRIVEILRNEKLAQRIGRAAQESVKKKYLITRLLNDFLKIYKGLFF